jgi:hypothetical protein
LEYGKWELFWIFYRLARWDIMGGNIKLDEPSEKNDVMHRLAPASTRGEIGGMHESFSLAAAGTAARICGIVPIQRVIRFCTFSQ